MRVILSVRVLCTRRDAISVDIILAIFSMVLIVLREREGHYNYLICLCYKLQEEVGAFSCCPLLFDIFVSSFHT